MIAVLLFTRQADFLGEIHVKDGAFVQAMLTARGEQALGAALNDWQMHGIPVFRHPASAALPYPEDGGFTLHRVQPRSAAFANALQEWCAQHTMVAVGIPSPLHMTCWQMLLHIPISPTDRFAMLSALVHGSADDLIAWQQFLADARTAV